MTVATIEGFVRGSNGLYVPVNLNENGDLITAAGMPEGAELTRQGARWATMSTGAVAGLVVRPTTVAAFEIWNGNAVGGKSLVVDRLFLPLGRRSLVVRPTHPAAIVGHR